MKELILIRHGKSPHAGERYIGRTDTPLTSRGYQQADWISNHLCKSVPDAVYVSPALRTRETLRPFLNKHQMDCVVEADLQEIDFGLWEGMSFEEIQAQAPELVTQWALNRMDFCFPGGERLEAFWKRVCRVGDVLASAPGERVAAVTHGGVIRYLLCHYLGLGPEQHRMFQIDFGSITTLTLQDGFAVLKGLNDHE